MSFSPIISYSLIVIASIIISMVSYIVVRLYVPFFEKKLYDESQSMLSYLLGKNTRIFFNTIEYKEGKKEKRFFETNFNNFINDKIKEKIFTFSQLEISIVFLVAMLATLIFKVKFNSLINFSNIDQTSLQHPYFYYFIYYFIVSALIFSIGAIDYKTKWVSYDLILILVIVGVVGILFDFNLFYEKNQELFFLGLGVLITTYFIGKFIMLGEGDYLIIFSLLFFIKSEFILVGLLLGIVLKLISIFIQILFQTIIFYNQKRRLAMVKKYSVFQAFKKSLKFNRLKEHPIGHFIYFGAFLSFVWQIDVNYVLSLL